MPFIIKTETIDNGLIANQPENPRLGITALRLWRQRSHFGKAEAETNNSSGTSAFLS